jgi:hypothetical protein
MEQKLTIPSADIAAWNIAEGESDGKPRLIRYRPDLESCIGNPTYPKRLVISWDYEVDNSNGMPTECQSEEMKAFEDALVEVLDPDRLAVLTFVLTNAGCREWHYYVNDVQEAGNRINSALSDFPKLPIHLQVEDDPEWEQLSAVYNICR